MERLFQIVGNYDRSATKIQKNVRRWLVQRSVDKLIEERESAAVKIQAGQLDMTYGICLVLHDVYVCVLGHKIGFTVYGFLHLHFLQFFVAFWCIAGTGRSYS